MMKKMLVLALVLGVVGLANAGLTIDKTALTNIKITDVLGGTTSSPLMMQITGTLVLDLSGAVTQPSLGVKSDVIYVLPSFAFAGAASAAGQYFVDGLIPGNPVPAYTPGYVIAQGIKFVSGNGDIMLFVSNGDGVPSGQAIASVNVPEPMTMGLLALGGLFLRKK